MQDNISKIFSNNIELLGWIDKAIIYFRECRYDKALESIARTGDGINITAEAVLEDREYFKLVSTESVAEMLKGILDAKRNRDYVLLADLYETQLADFICRIQELILRKEDYLAFSEEEYSRNIVFMSEKMTRSLDVIAGLNISADERERLRINQNALLEAPLDPAFMLREGYRVEFSSCGMMTLGAADISGRNIYLHTNGKILSEAFLLAQSWYDENADTYLVYGYGMGYHLHELGELAPEAHIIVYEEDINILKLSCAFAGGYARLGSNIDVVYDPDMRFLNERLASPGSGKVCIHYPSYRRLKNIKTRELLQEYIKWSKKVEEC